MTKYQMQQLPLTVAIGAVLSASSLQAAIITVDSANDGAIGAFPSECTLRAAVQAANTDAPVDGCQAGESGLDQIVFDPALAASTITIAASASPFVVTDSLRISGPTAGSAAGLLISGGGISTVFDIDGSSPGSIDVAMDSLTVTNGSGSGSIGGGVDSQNADLTLSQVSVDSNTSALIGGGISFTNGRLSLNEVAIQDNSAGTSFSAGGFAGGLFVANGDLELTGGIVSGNLATYGAGIYLESVYQATLDSVEISSNIGGSEGGGLLAAGSTEVTLSNCRVQDNRIFGSSGVGSGIRVNDSSLTLNDSEVRRNYISFSGVAEGGGIAALDSQLSVNRTVIDRNDLFADSTFSQDYGAGIALIGSSLTLFDSLITGNRCRALFSEGAAIFGQDAEVVIEGSRISGNIGAAPLSLSSGSTAVRDSEIALNLGDSAASAGSFRFQSPSLTNVTVSGNQSSSGPVLAFAGAGSADLTHVTLADNGVGVSIAAETGFALNLVNTVLSGPATAVLCDGPAESFTNSLATDDSCTGTATDAQDLALLPLAENGGPTRTHALQVGSVAIDAGGDCATVYGVLTDQRGVARDGSCDLGAFEFTEFIFSDRFTEAMPERR